MKGFAPRPIQYGHPCHLDDSGMGRQDTVDPKKPYTITSLDDHVVGARREWARALGVLLGAVADEIIAPTERFYQGQGWRLSTARLRVKSYPPCSDRRRCT
jgi:hypothetical protein